MTFADSEFEIYLFHELISLHTDRFYWQNTLKCPINVNAIFYKKEAFEKVALDRPKP